MTVGFFAVCTCDTHGRYGCHVHSCRTLVVRDGVYGMCGEPTPCPDHPAEETSRVFE